MSNKEPSSLKNKLITIPTGREAESPNIFDQSDALPRGVAKPKPGLTDGEIGLTKGTSLTEIKTSLPMITPQQIFGAALAIGGVLVLVLVLRFIYRFLKRLATNAVSDVALAVAFILAVGFTAGACVIVWASVTSWRPDIGLAAVAAALTAMSAAIAVLVWRTISLQQNGRNTRWRNLP